MKGESVETNSITLNKVDEDHGKEDQHNAQRPKIARTGSRGEQGMEKLMLNAIRILDEFGLESKDMMKNCQGIVILSAVEVACLVSGNVGSGIVLHQHPYGNWSAPCAISLTGLGAGLAAGIEKKDIIIFIMDKMTMHAFCGEGQMRLGINNALTLGSFAQETDLTFHASNRGVGATSSYVHSKGFFAGISLEGAVVVPKASVNTKFFGKKVSPTQILYGTTPAPQNASLIRLQEKLMNLIIKRREAARLHAERHVIDDAGAYVSVAR